MTRTGVASLPAVLTLLACLVLSACWPGRRSTLPQSLSDEEFWRLSESLSEPPGPFTHSENLVSNESHYVHLARLMRPLGGVYVGVGPEQNFTFIARFRPTLAFIVDIRGENRSLHLLYKALFEICEDRDTFVSRLFSREQPDGLGPDAFVADIFAAYRVARASKALLEDTRRRVKERLTGARKLPLGGGDVAWIDHVLDAFHDDGPAIHYARSLPNNPPGPSYSSLMAAADITGQARSFLATEDDYAYVRSLQLKNAIVPVVGDFAGPAALRRTGEYVRRHGGRVTAFYGSNVEVYLNRHRTALFCANLAALPHGTRSWFVGSKTLQLLSAKIDACTPPPAS